MTADTNPSHFQLGRPACIKAQKLQTRSPSNASKAQPEADVAAAKGQSFKSAFRRRRRRGVRQGCRAQE